MSQSHVAFDKKKSGVQTLEKYFTFRLVYYTPDKIDRL